MKVAFRELSGYEKVGTNDDRTQLFRDDGKIEVFDGQCTEAYLPDFLDFVEAHNITSFLHLLCDKLEHGGKLIVGGTEIIELTKNILNYTITHEYANQYIYSRGALHSLDIITDILLEYNMKIVKKQINGLNFLVEAVRP